MLKWTEYDGSAGTLPPEDTCVLVTKDLIHEAPEVLRHRHDGLFHYPLEGEEFSWASNTPYYWLPIPTPEHLAALNEVVEAARGLRHGEDWNNGTHAKTHGYRRKLLNALARLDALEVK